MKFFILANFIITKRSGYVSATASLITYPIGLGNLTLEREASHAEEDEKTRRRLRNVT